MCKALKQAKRSQRKSLLKEYCKIVDIEGSVWKCLEVFGSDQLRGGGEITGKRGASISALAMSTPKARAANSALPAQCVHDQFRYQMLRVGSRT